MTAGDLPAAQALSRAVSWPHRLEDWQFVHRIGQGLVACSADRVVGTAMWWNHEGKIARLGMVIVDPSLQRSGIGRALMQGVLARIGAPVVLLNATKEGEPLYRKLGFREFGSIVQHQGVPVAAPSASLRPGECIRAASRYDLATLATLDAAACGARREDIIAALIASGEAVVLEDAGTAVGFAFCRRFGRGHLIGPIVAPDATHAKTLIAHLIVAQAGTFLRIDVPGASGLSDWLEQARLLRVDEVVAMARGEPPEQGEHFRAFAAVNQALG